MSPNKARGSIRRAQRAARHGVIAALALAVAACSPGGGASKASSSPPLEGARIGGPFTLTDQNGKTRTDGDFAGKYRIVYFGYSFCPDICPVDLQKLMQGLAAFERSDAKRGAQIQPIFITVDPARDTSAALAPFVARYHPRLIGLTGTPDQIAAVAKAYAVQYNKVEGSAPERYLMAHSQMAFLMGPTGKPLALLPLDDPGTEADEGAPDNVAADLARWVR